MIVDARSRPPGDAFGGLSDRSTTETINRRFGFETPASFLSSSLDAWRSEHDAAGIDVTLAVGRNTESCRIDNDALARIQDDAGGGVLAVAGIDVAGLVHDPLNELARCVDRLGILAIAIDPGTARGQRPDVSGVPFHGAKVIELAAACAELDVPIVCLTGPYGGSGLYDASPAVLEPLVARCPDTKIVASHGCYPFVTEAIACAWRHPNLYLCPDLYVSAPAGDLYLEAAGASLSGQVLFGSAYPYAGPQQMLDRLDESSLSGPARDAYLGGTAASVFARGLTHLGHAISPPAAQGTP